MKKSYSRAKTKGESLSLRVPARSKWAVDFWTPLQEQSDTAFVQSAIEYYVRHLEKESRHQWRALFHSHPGVRALRLFTLDGYPLDDERARQREFVMEHRMFFYGSDNEVIAPNVETLWDAKTELSQWQKLGVKDYYESGRAMAKALEARGLDAPEWPPRKAKR
jgi:hypothetical protein